MCDCGGKLKHKTIHVRIEEDIPVAKKRLKRLLIERGACSKCRKVTTGKDKFGQPYRLNGQTTILGSDVRLYVCYLLAIVGLSYSKIIHLIYQQYQLKISSGQIVSIAQKQAKFWVKSYTELLERIRGSPFIFIDETPWNIKGMKGYAWVVSNGQDVYFLSADSRKLEVAQKLLKNYHGVRISDDYAVYISRDLPGKHQTCWVHLFRKIRDLYQNKSVPKSETLFVESWYQQFSTIYADLRSYLDQPYDSQTRQQQLDELASRVDDLTDQSPLVNQTN